MKKIIACGFCFEKKEVTARESNDKNFIIIPKLFDTKICNDCILILDKKREVLNEKNQ